MRTLLLTPLLLVASLSAATYDENYRVVDLNKSIEANYNVFMHGDFEQIIRYEMISMEDDSDNNSSAEVVDKAIKKIQEIEDAGKTVKVSIIGHTNSATDDMNEKSIDSDTYANKIQNWFRSEFDTNTSNDLATEYAEEIKEMFLDENISQEILFPESRGGLDQGFTEATSEGKELSNRVMVTLYVYEKVDIDSDGDGVFDLVDKCPNSPRGNIVDNDGCPVDSDGDGVLDYKDTCPKTPQGVAVDTKGCPLDSDKDGVVDYKDKCPETPLGLQVDPNGCPLKSKLHINFKISSDKILEESHPEVQKFAQFMKDNPTYKAEIIGHTDSRGKAVVNMDLSQRRAESAKNALIAEGVDASRLTSSGRGELDPIGSNRTLEGRRANRRTEVQLSY
ncbi:MAG: OmpA family protein [Campylobacterota bacterium]|nr:OmpA family protein [Campylobacterota bacterium]